MSLSRKLGVLGQLFFLSLLVSLTITQSSFGFGSLRFYGNGINAPDQDRVKIRIDNPDDSLPGPPVDVGATDFTIEFWIKADSADNIAPAITAGPHNDWIYGNIILDRDRYNQDRKYGISVAGGKIAFGVTGTNGNGTPNVTIVAPKFVLDNQWHHVAVIFRRIGYMSIFVDGDLQTATGIAPTGDVSYPDSAYPGNFCSGPCVNSDPFLVIGAEKHDAGSQFPSFNGYMDELRISTSLRYSTSGSSFIPSITPFVTDSVTAALYHFDEGSGSVLTDVSGASGGPSNGELHFGSTPTGPEWSIETPFDTTIVDTDGDQIPDSSDNCPTISNANQLDADGDEIGNVCDNCTDLDGDGFGNPGFPANTCGSDNCPNTSNPDQINSDGDSQGDVCDFCPNTYAATNCCVGPIRGDINGNGALGVIDLNQLVAYMFTGSAPLSCFDEADMNANCAVNVLDLNYMVAYFFSGGPAPLSCP